MAFACPTDCGWCCTHLAREEAPGERGFREALREEGVYGCGDPPGLGLALQPGEARRLREEAAARGLRVDLHPRTFLLETRRRVAVVLDWHLAHEACPFYADFRCTAYDARPLQCRAYPVMLGAPGWRLAPACPESAPTLAAGRLGGALRLEARARAAMERAHAATDETAMRLLALPGARFAKGLPTREAARRVRRYRIAAPEEILSTVPARSSTS